MFDSFRDDCSKAATQAANALHNVWSLAKENPAVSIPVGVVAVGGLAALSITKPWAVKSEVEALADMVPGLGEQEAGSLRGLWKVPELRPPLSGVRADYISDAVNAGLGPDMIGRQVFGWEHITQQTAAVRESAAKIADDWASAIQEGREPSTLTFDPGTSRLTHVYGAGIPAFEKLVAGGMEPAKALDGVTRFSDFFSRKIVDFEPPMASRVDWKEFDRALTAAKANGIDPVEISAIHWRN